MHSGGCHWTTLSFSRNVLINTKPDFFVCRFYFTFKHIFPPSDTHFPSIYTLNTRISLAKIFLGSDWLQSMSVKEVWSVIGCWLCHSKNPGNLVNQVEAHGSWIECSPCSGKEHFVWIFKCPKSFLWENRTHSGFPCAAANVSVVTEITGRISIRRGVSAFKQPVSVFRE